MTSSPDVSRGSIAARNERGADRAAESGRWNPRETLLLRGASAADAVPYRRTDGAAVWGRRATDDAGSPPAQPRVRPAPAPASRAAAAGPSHPLPPAAAAATARAVLDPGTSRGDQSAGMRLGEVYAEQLARLREEARRAGWAAGHAEGLVAADTVVAAAERAAEDRLADVQARWERRLASATAAMGAAVERLDSAATPVVDELRDSILDAVLILVGDLLGRELAMAASPGLDALCRALTLCPGDVPVVVRLHPDDLAEVPADALTQLPASVTVLGDAAV